MTRSLRWCHPPLMFAPLDNWGLSSDDNAQCSVIASSGQPDLITQVILEPFFSHPNLKRIFPIVHWAQGRPRQPTFFYFVTYQESNHTWDRFPFVWNLSICSFSGLMMLNESLVVIKLSVSNMSTLLSHARDQLSTSHNDHVKCVIKIPSGYNHSRHLLHLSHHYNILKICRRSLVSPCAVGAVCLCQ